MTEPIRKTRGFAWTVPANLHEKDVTVKHEIQELARRPCYASPVSGVDEAALYAAVAKRNAERVWWRRAWRAVIDSFAGVDELLS